QRKPVAQYVPDLVSPPGNPIPIHVLRIGQRKNSGCWNGFQKSQAKVLLSQSGTEFKVLRHRSVAEFDKCVGRPPQRERLPIVKVSDDRRPLNLYATLARHTPGTTRLKLLPVYRLSVKSFAAGNTK